MGQHHVAHRSSWIWDAFDGRNW